MARRARPQPPLPLIHWGDDLTIALFARAPYSSHDAIRVLCRKFNHLLRSDAFRQERLKSKYAETGAAIVEKFVFAALFPVNLLLILLTGGAFPPRSPKPDLHPRRRSIPCASIS